MSGCCERGNETSGSKQCEECLEWIRDRLKRGQNSVNLVNALCLHSFQVHIQVHTVHLDKYQSLLFTN
jgi:hypothetical protein